MLMVDAGGSDSAWSQGYKWALRTARMLDAYGVAWFEEPLPPDAIEDYTHLRRRSPVPISGGEVLTRRQAFQPWIEGGALDIVQPDVTKVGGTSELRRIAWSAHDHGVKLVPHGWNTAVGLATDLQLASALPDTDLVEYVTGSPYIDELTTDRWTLDADGMLPIPDGPASVSRSTASASRATATSTRCSGARREPRSLVVTGAASGSVGRSPWAPPGTAGSCTCSTSTPTAPRAPWTSPGRRAGTGARTCST